MEEIDIPTADETFAMAAPCPEMPLGVDNGIDNKYAVVEDNGAKWLDEITVTTVDYNP